MDSKRTPGEWFVHHDSRGYAVETERVRIVNLGHSDECAKADAHLMAAAPDLLEALQEVVTISDRTHDAWDKARAAIAKALGHNAQAVGLDAAGGQSHTSDGLEG